MPYLAQTGDFTKNNNGTERQEIGFRPAPAMSYPVGSVVKIAPMDQQVYPDDKTIIPTTTAANQQLVMGLVSDTWSGFNASIPPSTFTSAANPLAARGSQVVDVITVGPHPAGLVDQSGAGAVAIANETPLIPSRATAGYMQGGAAAAGLGNVAVAQLPAAGVGSAITAGALAQASATDTIAGAPATGDVLTVTIQAPYNTVAPGTVQTLSWSTTLTAAQAASATTAAAALVAYLNAQPSFAQYFVASNAAGVVTIAVNALATPFLLTYGGGTTVYNQISLSLSGSAANGLTFAVSAVGGSTATASAATLTGGTGFKGSLPVYVS